MTIRAPRERLLQTLCYEAGGIVLATPLYSLVFGTDTGSSFGLLALLAMAVMIWSPLHNVLFDMAEWRVSHRLASDRPHWLRVIHAVSHEATSLVLTLPILLAFGGLTLPEALLADLGLTGLYALYAYGFHITYDRLRPVRTGPGVTAHIEEHA